MVSKPCVVVKDQCFAPTYRVSDALNHAEFGLCQYVLGGVSCLGSVSIGMELMQCIAMKDEYDIASGQYLTILRVIFMILVRLRILNAESLLGAHHWISNMVSSCRSSRA
jgi:hypothetical protein